MMFPAAAAQVYGLAAGESVKGAEVGWRGQKGGVDEWETNCEDDRRRFVAAPNSGMAVAAHTTRFAGSQPRSNGRGDGGIEFALRNGCVFPGLLGRVQVLAVERSRLG
jgi:hypothetical protein